MLLFGVVAVVVFLYSCGYLLGPLQNRSSSHQSLEPNNKYEIDFKEIKQEKELGRGSFGVVFQGQWRNHQVAGMNSSNCSSR